MKRKFSPAWQPAVIQSSCILLLGFWLGGCSPQTAPPQQNTAGNSQPSPSPQDQKKVVLTTFTVLADMAQNVAGDKAIVESLTKPGSEIHDYEPTPSDLTRAQSADLILDNGLGLERWAERFYGNLKDVPHATLTAGIEPIPVSDGPYKNKPNPHAWMSPRNAVIYVENIRKALVNLDPANAATYTANAAAYSEQIKAINAPLQKDLAVVPASKRFMVTCEGAFSYLTRDYDLKELYLWAMNSEQEGTPQQIRRVVDTVKANQIPVVFCESTVNDKAQRQVASEANAKFGGAFYVDSLSDERGSAPTYLKLLKFNVKTLVDGLKGKS